MAVFPTVTKIGTNEEIWKKVLIVDTEDVVFSVGFLTEAFRTVLSLIIHGSKQGLTYLFVDRIAAQILAIWTIRRGEAAYKFS